MFDRELETAADIVREVCHLTRAVQDQVVAAQARVLKSDRSPVTLADLACQVVVSARLATAFPDDPLMAEEDSTPFDQSRELEQRVLEVTRRSMPDLTAAEVRPALDRASHPGGSGRFWVLDPIDGTKGFLRGEQYAVALALVEEGRVMVAVLGCPNLPVAPGDEDGPRGCLLTAARGRGAHHRAVDNGTASRISVQPEADPASATACESVEGEHSCHDQAARIAAAVGLVSPPLRMDSQCKYGLVARGEATMYLRLPKHEAWYETAWDHAAGSLVVEEAGGRVTDLSGRPLDFSGRALDVRYGILASNGSIHERVVQAAQEICR